MGMCLLSDCQKEVVYPTFNAPQWEVVDNPEYAVTMTVIAEIPDHIAKVAQEGDELAAFVGDECRGMAKKVNQQYFIMIHGVENETPNFHFRYYSAATRNMYRTGDTYQFKADEMLGTVDNPEKLLLEIVKE